MIWQGVSADRAIVTTGPEGLSVTVGPGGIRAGGASLSVGLFFWSIAELWASTHVWHMGPVDVLHFPAMLGAFPVVWLALWSIFGYSIGKQWLFAFWGRQQLVVGPSSVALRSILFGQSRSREFPIDDIQNVRIFGAQGITMLAISPGQSQPQEVTIDQTPTVWASGTPIVFDVRGKNYRFGTNLSADTVQTIRDAMGRSRKG